MKLIRLILLALTPCIGGCYHNVTSTPPGAKIYVYVETPGVTEPANISFGSTPGKVTAIPTLGPITQKVYVCWPDGTVSSPVTLDKDVHFSKTEAEGKQLDSYTNKEKNDLIKVVSYEYNESTRHGKISVLIENHDMFTVRKWLQWKIGEICSTKNRLSVAGEEEYHGGMYRVLNESNDGHILTLEFVAGQ